MIKYFDCATMLLIEEYPYKPGTVIPRTNEWVNIRGTIYQVDRIIHLTDPKEGNIHIYVS